MINQIISIFIPSIITLYINEQNNLYRGIRYYLMHVMLVNLFSYIVTVYIFEQPYIEFTYMFTIKYIILSSLIAFCIAQTEKQYSKHLEIEIKVEKSEVKEKNRK